jgi:hypothetical protein
MYKNREINGVTLLQNSPGMDEKKHFLLESS